MISRPGRQYSSLPDASTHKKMQKHLKVLRLFLKGNALTPCNAYASSWLVSYLSSQCKQCHPEDLLTLGLSPFAEGALEFCCSSVVRTQESAVDIKGKTNIKIYGPLDFLDYELSKSRTYQKLAIKNRRVLYFHLRHIFLPGRIRQLQQDLE